MDFDEALHISELKRDSQHAFRVLYDHYAVRLFSFCMQYTHSREKSEELVEDTFVWLWNNRHTIQQETTLKSLLFIRMRHYVINAYRATVNAPIFEDYVDYLGHFTCGTTDGLEYDDFVKMLNAAIDKLPETQRKIIKLSRLEMKSNKEIAQLLGLKEQTIKNQLVLAIKALRKRLKPFYAICHLLFFVN